MLSLNPDWPWITAGLLGVFHGINPAMGWLFAVALGLQEERRSAVLAALGPIALGHAASVGAVILALGAARLAVPPGPVRLVAGAALVGFGVFRLARPWAHPRWVGMRVGFRDLTLWSFLMSSAHGAGLMLAPAVLGLGDPHERGGAHHAAGLALPGLALLGVHTAAMFAVMALVALLVYETVGVRLLRRAWVNLDLFWALALVLAGVATLWLWLAGSATRHPERSEGGMTSGRAPFAALSARKERVAGGAYPPRGRRRLTRSA